LSIKTIVLCGGRGTRIRDVADDIPKPMILIGSRPVLWHIMKIYSWYGLNEFILCLGYKGWTIKEFFLNYRAFSSSFTIDLGKQSSPDFHDNLAESWRVTLAETGDDTQTAGRLWKAKPYVEDSAVFCVTYGDGVANVDIGKLLDFHKAHGRIATVTGVRPPGRFGVMALDQQDGFSVVNDFQEKPQTTGGRINGGFFVFDRRVWDYLNEDERLVLEHEPLAGLARDGELVMYEHDGFWQPMDTYREWKTLNDMWATGNAPWKVW